MSSKHWFYPLLTLLVLLIITVDCKKDDDDDDDDLPKPTIPILITGEVTEITQNTAKCCGIITSNGGDSIIARGVCWDIIPTPLESGSKTIDDPGLRSDTSLITGLTANTTYYVRAYATNSAGTGYGAFASFTTAELPPNPVTDYDGNIYQTVRIGNQIWMAENLKTKHYANGAALVDGIGLSKITSYKTKYYFAYKDNESNVDTYGRLYKWAAVMNGASSSNTKPSAVQGVCPAGWHVPSDNEWKQLDNFLGVFDTGIKLKEADTSHWTYYNDWALGTNEYNFRALPGGRRKWDGHFEHKGSHAYFWSSTLNEIESFACMFRLDYNSSDAARFCNYSRENGFSVRCIKD